jgi:hypothetical protein
VPKAPRLVLRRLVVATLHPLDGLQPDDVTLDVRLVLASAGGLLGIGLALRHVAVLPFRPGRSGVPPSALASYGTAGDVYVTDGTFGQRSHSAVWFPPAPIG